MTLHSFLGEENPLGWFNCIATGPVIGYRRVSGKIGLTDREKGTRGAWVEKRVALFKQLCARGVRIELLSPTTPTTTEAGVALGVYNPKIIDILFLEFGGANLQFYRQDWERTFQIIKDLKGKRVYFICDDPDLTFPWKEEILPWANWTVLANATDMIGTATALKAPSTLSSIIDFPMHIGLDPAGFTNMVHPEVVYIGRPNGRKKHFDLYQHARSLVIAGHAEEWKEYPNLRFVPVPQQAHRRDFYREFTACLSVFDNKHQQCGWRTGRAYHAVYAGVPVVAPPGNPGLYWTHTCVDAADLDEFVKLDELTRREIWVSQLNNVEGEKDKAHYELDRILR